MNAMFSSIRDFSFLRGNLFVGQYKLFRETADTVAKHEKRLQLSQIGRLQIAANEE